MNTLWVGTRGSPLALAQTNSVCALLQKAHPGLTIQTRIIKTSGDLFAEASLERGGGKGLFTKEIEEQLLDGRIHLAVHSLKDLPTTLPDGLFVAATLPREDPRDVFIAKRVAKPSDLPVGARVGTSSLRRRAQLMARRPDLQIEELRGNVGTRLRKLAERDDLDAIVVAAAGLKRLGLYEAGWTPLDIHEMIPAVGQGIIAVEARVGDQEVLSLLAAVNDADTMACAEAERAFLRAAGGGCRLPYAAHATVRGEDLELIAARFTRDGSRVQKANVRGPKKEPRRLGEEAARRISE